MRVLFLPRYGPLAGSSRYMSYDFLPYYRAAGIECDIAPLLDDHYLQLSLSKTLSSGARRRAIMRYVLRQAVSRVGRLLQVRRYDVVVLEKDLIPNLPYALETILFALNRRVVSMYDEPTHAYYRAHSNPVVRAMAGNKVDRIIRRSAHVVAWNPIVRDYALRLNPNVTTVTTGIDLRRYQPLSSYQTGDRPLRIGWIGSPSGYQYLHMLDDMLRQLSARYPLELVVVSSDPYQADGVVVDNRRWSVQTEVPDLRSMDIGIMPLPDTEWAAGKSGCKMLQYMGVGLPVVVSPVGINAEIVIDGVNGYAATSPDGWYTKLAALIEDPALRQRIGREGYQHIVEHNSQTRIAEILTNVLFEVAGSPLQKATASTA